MKLLDDNTALTTHECDLGAEWDIKVSFGYQEFEPEQPNPDLPGVGPGCEAGVMNGAVERNEPIYDVDNWVEYDGYTENELKDLATEIHELINKQAADEADEDMSEGTIWGRGA